LDFEITMDAFLVPLPATTSGSAPENKSVLFFMFINTLGMQYNTTCKKSVTPPTSGSA